MGKRGGDGEDDGWRSGFAGRIEIRESATGRREWPEAVKGRIVRESLETGASVKDVAQLRIPEHPVARSDDIRSGIPGYPVTLSAHV